MGHRVICIGRQFGSGGHEIAVRTAERLGIRVYERELLHLACKYGELSAKLMESSDERATNPYLYQGVYEGNYHVIRGLPTSEVLFALQSHEIKRIAEEETAFLWAGVPTSSFGIRMLSYCGFLFPPRKDSGYAERWS